MTTISSLTNRDSGSPESETEANERAVDLPTGVGSDGQIPDSSPPLRTPEFIFGPTQLASLAFVGILLIGLMSAIAYFAGRKNSSPQVTERVIERVIQAPQAALAVPANPVSAAAAKPAVEQAHAPAPVATSATPVITAAQPSNGTALLKPKAEMTTPIFNQVYLQLGSVEIGVAEVMVEGLRQRGVPATVGIGISGKVARVLVGPFSSPDELRVAQKHVEELGFHPFPRVFTPRDLEPQPAEGPASGSPVAPAAAPVQHPNAAPVQPVTPPASQTPVKL